MIRKAWPSLELAEGTGTRLPASITLSHHFHTATITPHPHPHKGTHRHRPRTQPAYVNHFLRIRLISLLTGTQFPWSAA